MKEDFKNKLNEKAKAANEAVLKFLPPEKGFASLLAESANYSVKAGGKRLRPVMMAETYAICGGKGKSIEPFMAAMEYIHTSSLIHDDLPALDNDVLRRGKPTTWSAYGESCAILAGDALINYAYETLFDAAEAEGGSRQALRAARIIAKKAGLHGMLGGQSVDVQTDKEGFFDDTADLLAYIYENKTAALIEASLMAGAVLAGCDDKTEKAFEEIGRLIGLAFQIQDDILDVTSTDEELGKNVMSDIENGKDTYVSLFGVEKAGAEVKRLTAEAMKKLAELDIDGTFLVELFEYMTERKN